MASYNWHKPETIIAENARRLDEINAPYNPLVGTPYCDEIKRYRVEFHGRGKGKSPFSEVWLPVEMKKTTVCQLLDKCGWDLMKTGRVLYGGAATEAKAMEIFRWFHRERCKYDFEYWCGMQISIEHKITLQMVPFYLNRAQRFYLRTLERLRKENSPIFVILLKARQWGGSTITQFYMVWIQLFWRKNWHSIIAADIDEHSQNVQSMFQRALDEYPSFINYGQKITFTPYKNMKATRVITPRGARVTIGSVMHPEFIRSSNVTMAHLTEIGVWPTTKKHDPQSLVQSLAGSIQPKPYRVKVLESTAKGVGNYFHRSWLGAVAGENNLTPVFVPWYMIDFYQRPVHEGYVNFIKSMTAYERMLFDKGATLEAIAYYRDLSNTAEFRDNPKGLLNEFPTTPEEAFQSSGRNFYPTEYVEKLRNGVCEPKFVGEIVGNDRMGEESLQNVHLSPESNGRLKVWVDKDDREEMNDRYLVVVDIGGRSEKADRSVIVVFDRYWMMDGMGVPEVAAEWAGHIDWDLLGWKAAQIATYYDNALLVVESNTLEMKGSEGNHFNTLLSTIAEVYPNMFCRTPAEQLVKGGELHYGFQTNHSTKPMVCDYELMVLREDMYIEHCADAVDEHITFEVKENGELGAVEGNHDDRHITRAIGNYFNYRVMPPPTFAKSRRSYRFARPRSRSEMEVI